MCTHLKCCALHSESIRPSTHCNKSIRNKFLVRDSKRSDVCTITFLQIYMYISQVPRCSVYVGLAQACPNHKDVVSAVRYIYCRPSILALCPTRKKATV